MPFHFFFISPQRVHPNFPRILVGVWERCIEGYVGSVYLEKIKHLLFFFSIKKKTQTEKKKFIMLNSFGNVDEQSPVFQ